MASLHFSKGIAGEAYKKKAAQTYVQRLILY